MNTELGILAATLIIGGISLILVCVCIYKQRKSRELIEFTYKQIEELENSLVVSKTTLETATRQTADQSRRIAWLETRVRQPKLAKKDVLAETSSVYREELPKASITERRHQILKLAAHGQSAEKIAETLGMVTGEVELIINLNRASFAQFA